MTRELRLAEAGALSFVPAALVSDAILAELDEWAEHGFVLLDCGCIWRIEDVDDIHDHEHT